MTYPIWYFKNVIRRQPTNLFDCEMTDLLICICSLYNKFMLKNYGNDDDEEKIFQNIESAVDSVEGASALKDTLDKGIVLAFTTPIMRRAHSLR